MRSYQTDLCFIITSFRTTHFQIKDYMIRLAGQSLSTSQHWGVVVQELTPMVDIVPERHLVADIANNNGGSLLLVLNNSAQRLSHRNTHRIETLAQF